MDQNGGSKKQKKIDRLECSEFKAGFQYQHFKKKNQFDV